MPGGAGERMTPTHLLPGSRASPVEIDSAGARCSAVETAERATALYAERQPSDEINWQQFDETLSAAQGLDSPPELGPGSTGQPTAKRHGPSPQPSSPGGLGAIQSVARATAC